MRFLTNAAPFRLVEVESGSIVIDGVDVGLIAVHNLRSRLAFVPQVPSITTACFAHTCFVLLYFVSRFLPFVLQNFGTDCLAC